MSGFKLDLTESTVVLLVVAAVAFVAGRSVPTAPENLALAQLSERFGPAHYSQWAEEWIVRDYFNDKRNGVFLDVGAYDYQRLSNTYYLEKELGWSGLAIEPQAKFAPDYGKYRPRTIFVPRFVSDHSDDEVILNVPSSRDNVASANKEFADSYARSEPVQVATSTLDDILAQHPIGHIDFLSMDVELSEPAALRGFSIDRHRPTLVCVEAHPPVRQEILNYFASHGYTLLAKYLDVDRSNYWFAAADTKSPV